MSQLKQYLDYYQTRDKPGYAVLVTGAWGVGKTFQVKRALGKDKAVYVSLFGLATATEVYEAVFAAMFPEIGKAKGALEANRDTTIGGLPIFGVASQIFGMFIREQADVSRTLVFDDLERSPLKAADLLGIINRYVEHHSCRVVVVAHEGRLTKSLLQQREKVFGQVIRAFAETDAAYDAFARELAPNSKILKDYKSILIETFHESEVESLRILRHVMEDTLRLVSSLTPEQISNDRAMNELVSLLAALNMEKRAERLSRQDVQERPMAEFNLDMARRGNAKIEITPFVRAKNRYSKVDLTSSTISDSTITEILFDGVFSTTAIQSDLQRSAHFATRAELAPWRLFIDWQSQDDVVAMDAMNRLNDQFKKREVTKPGEMLHIFALQLMMAHYGLSNKTIDEVQRECILYVDDLKNTGRLEPSERSLNSRDEFSIRSGFEGHAYWLEDPFRPQFETIFAHLSNSRHAVMLNALPKGVPELLEIVRRDGQEFYDLLNHTNGGKATYANVPILASIDPLEFVTAWMESHPSNWYWVQQAIEERLKHPSKIKELEAPWVASIATVLEELADRSPPLRAMRIMRRIPQVDRTD
jgi:hypothetical protein